MRIAIIHDWLTGMRGGEKVLSLLCGLMPEADLYTLFHVRGACDGPIEAMPIRTSFLDRLPGVRRYYRHLLPLMPAAVEQFDLGRYDLVVSCSHCVAKGVARPERGVHLCYCLTPMRYVWDQEAAYREVLGRWGWVLGCAGGYLRAWDRRTAGRVDRFVACSRNVAGRIWRCYSRDAAVVYPPIDVSFFTPAPVPREDWYLVVASLVPYKRVDQAVAAMASLGRPLRVIGEGPLAARLRRQAPANVALLGWRSDETIRDHYRRARALLHPGEEDFGLVPLEAMACGTPVIAYGAGGALETVLAAPNGAGFGPTGVLYAPQTAEALAEAVRRFEREETALRPEALARWARTFTPERFIESFKAQAAAALAAKGLQAPWPRPGST